MTNTKDIFAQLKEKFQLSFPKTAELVEQKKLNVSWDHLISPFELEISPKSIERMNEAVKEIFKWSRSRPHSYKTQNHSVLMSYDFHTNEDGEAKLIEINTNASGYLIGSLGTSLREEIDFLERPEIKSLKYSFLAEFGDQTESPSIAIVDDQVMQQKMLIEFYLYKELFEQFGWTAEICEAKDLRIENETLRTPTGTRVNFVYNRTTDFFLTAPDHQALNEAWSKNYAVVSPQPKEYDLLADKNRLLELQASRESLPQSIQDVLLQAYEFKDFQDADELWKKRKKFFFKPKMSFGGKSVYRGQSLSHKVFDRIIKEDPMIQEYFPPQKWQEWKFDIRCFAFKDEIQFVTARLYQGQVTNFSTPNGGFCPVRLKS